MCENSGGQELEHDLADSSQEMVGENDHGKRVEIGKGINKFKS